MKKEMIPFNWYARAKERIERFLPGLDQELQVDVDTDVITPHNGSAEYTTFLLTFWHPSNQKLRWNMEIRMDEVYMEHELEAAVRKIYFARIE